MKAVTQPNPPAQTEARLFDADQLAELFGCSRRHVERMDSAGKLPAAIRIGRLKRWKQAELRAWLDAGAPDRRTWESRQGARR